MSWSDMLPDNVRRWTRRKNKEDRVEDEEVLGERKYAEGEERLETVKKRKCKDEKWGRSDRRRL